MKEYKTEIQASVLAGVICGAISLGGLLFVTPERWYLSFGIAVLMGGIVFYKSATEKKKNSGKYEKDEHLIDFPYIFSAEGYLRKDSDQRAKFYFGEDRIGVLYYKNVRPHVEEFEKERIKAVYPDRCGWISVLLEGESRRIVIPKKDAEKASSVLEEMLAKD